MKLYTEEQVRETISNTLRIINSEKTWTYDDVINLLTPIELPSDEEILVASDEFELNSRVSLGMHISFEIGAKWMRDKIQGGNQ